MISEQIPFLNSLLIRNYRNFKGEKQIRFSEIGDSRLSLLPSFGPKEFLSKKYKLNQWTVFLGNNGTGKTNLLKLISNFNMVSFYSDHDKYMKYFPSINKAFDKLKESSRFAAAMDFCVKDESDEYNLGESEFILAFEGECQTFDDHEDGTSYSQNDVLQFGNSGMIRYCGKVLNSFKSFESFEIYAYGAHRNISTESRLSTSNQCHNGDSLYGSGVNLINIEEWLLRIEFSRTSNNQRAESILNKLKELFNQNIFPDLANFTFATNETFDHYVLFETPNGKFRFSELSWGYQSSLNWIFDFCKKMFDRYPNSENPLHEPAIVLIDEIDMHLHPKWQRTIIHDLSVAFPNTQFIVTTHSPLIIQSIKHINLYVLSNTSNGTEITHCDEKTFQGWNVEEILSDLMNLGEDTRPPKYQKLKDDFEDAMNLGDLEKGEKAYSELKEIIHPQNVENTLLDIDMGQLKTMQDD